MFCFFFLYIFPTQRPISFAIWIEMWYIGYAYMYINEVMEENRGEEKKKEGKYPFAGKTSLYASVERFQQEKFSTFAKEWMLDSPRETVQDVKSKDW